MLLKRVDPSVEADFHRLFFNERNLKRDWPQITLISTDYFLKKVIKKEIVHRLHWLIIQCRLVSESLSETLWLRVFVARKNSQEVIIRKLKDT